MADPIIIDDGGSTRIKQIKAGQADGDLDELLDHQDAEARGSFTQVKVLYITPAGVAVDGGLTVLNGLDVVVISKPSQRVTLKTTAVANPRGNNCNVAVSPSAMLEIKSSKGQRRYVVSNAGAIQEVRLGGGPNYTTLFDANATPSLYTMVYLI